MTVEGLQEITPALDALIEGNGQEFELTSELMGRIEAALLRLAEDDDSTAAKTPGTWRT